MSINEHYMQNPNFCPFCQEITHGDQSPVMRAMPNGMTYTH